MLNLRNNQLKHLAYGAIGLILIVLLLNIFLTKINNNYDNSTFESFGNIRKGVTNKSDSDHDPVKTSLKAGQIKTSNIKKQDLEDIKHLFIVNEIKYIKDQMNDVSKSSADIEPLMEDKKFIDHVTNADKIFSYLNSLINNHDQAKK